MMRHKPELHLLALCFFAAAIPASILALAWLYFLLSLDHYGLTQKALGLPVGLLILIHFSRTTLFVFRRAGVTHQGEALIHALGLALTVIGSAWLVWAVHLGLTSSDWEYYGLLTAGATAAQGSLSLLMIRQRSAGLV